MKRRCIILLMICLLAVILAVSAAATSEDTVIKTVSAMGIMTGDGSGDLKLGDNVTRAQFAKLLATSSTYRDSLGKGTKYSLYSDVKSNHWAVEYIRIAAEEGWMIGYTDGSFHPDGRITLEEACTAALRVLGFDSSSLQGAYPNAQLNKAQAIGLCKQISRKRGEVMTRRDCAFLFYNLLTSEEKSGKIHGTVLGCTMKDGEIDYLAIIRKDLEGPFIARTGSKLPFTPTLTYRNGSLTKTALAANDVYYYNPTIRIVWIYSERVSGKIASLQPDAISPEKVTVAGTTYAIADQNAAHQLSVLGGGKTDSYVTLLLGMDNEVAGILSTVGPRIATGADKLPFTPTTVYRNGALSTSGTLAAYDVYYYDASQGTLWIYTEKVSGKIGAIAPKNEKPTSVTVNGSTYAVAGDQAANHLIALGENAEDTYVTLLLGMNNEAADVLTTIGPCIATGSDTLPFTPTTVYRNGASSASSALAAYDVYYYDAAQKTVWIYTEKVSGKIGAVFPKNDKPTSVTVDGTTYAIGGDLAADRLIELGENAEGAFVTVLLGMNGEAADVLTTVGPCVATGSDTLPFTPTTIYRNGYRTLTATPEPQDVYYYDAAQKTLWIYSEKVTGKIDAVMPRNGTPESVTVGGKTYTLANDSVADRLIALGDKAEGAIVTVLLGMNGEAADIMATSGPFVAVNGETLSFTPTTIYRNGYRAASASLAPQNVYYCDETQKTVWIYTEQTTGRISAVSPKNGKPTSVTVDGKEYTLADDRAADRLIELGENAEDTYVTLLLGMDDCVADILTGNSLDSVFRGVVQGTVRSATQEGTAAPQTELKLFCTDGRSRTFTINQAVTYEEGTLVTVTVTGSGAEVQNLQSKPLTGIVDANALHFAGYEFAEKAEIIDVSATGDAISIKPTRIASTTLSTGAVKFYELNTAGKISKLILNDVTGDTWSYIYITEASNTNTDRKTSSSYRYMLNGASRSIQSGNTAYPVTTGGAAICFKLDGAIKQMRQLTETEITSLTSQVAIAGGQQFKLDENVQVYLKRDSEYYPTTVEAVSARTHNLVGWYDRFGCAAGGKIRVIIATEKEN